MFRRLIFIFFTVAAAACGQNISSSLLGRVTDTSGAPVAGAAVTVANSETGAVNHAASMPTRSC